MYAVAIQTTHENYHRGGRKLHLFNKDTGAILCGFKPDLFSETGPERATSEWVNQHDPDENICISCKRIFNKKEK